MADAAGLPQAVPAQAQLHCLVCPSTYLDISTHLPGTLSVVVSASARMPAITVTGMPDACKSV
jgi:hypothetical protein